MEGAARKRPWDSCPLFRDQGDPRILGFHQPQHGWARRPWGARRHGWILSALCCCEGGRRVRPQSLGGGGKGREGVDTDSCPVPAVSSVVCQGSGTCTHIQHMAQLSRDPTPVPGVLVGHLHHQVPVCAEEDSDLGGDTSDKAQGPNGPACS